MILSASVMVSLQYGPLIPVSGSHSSETRMVELASCQHSDGLLVSAGVVYCQRMSARDSFRDSDLAQDLTQSVSAEWMAKPVGGKCSISGS